MLVVLEIDSYVVIPGGRNIDGHGEAGLSDVGLDLGI